MDILDKTGITEGTQDSEGVQEETVTAEELEVFNEYLTSVSTALLDLDSPDIFHKFIHSEENLKIIQSFVTDKNYRSLIVSRVEEFSKPTMGDASEDNKIAEKAEEEDTINADDAKNRTVSIVLDLKIAYKGGDTQSIAFIKRQRISTIDLHKSKRGVGKQLQVLNLGFVGEETEVFRLANIYVDNGLIPLFASYKSKKTSDDTTSGRIDEIEQLLAKLRLEFIHCTQDQIVQEVKLFIPPKILEKKSKFEAEGKQLKEEDFEEELKDRAFFESLKKCINAWTKEIQKVTYMRTDFPLDSVLTEITFWRNREQSLQQIQEQLESTEIQTVFNLLKKDTTMNNVVFSFLANINVVHEHKKAQEFNLILKDCPINALISAKDLKDTQKAIIDIFNHFKIFKNQSSYPMKRFKNLLEAFSNDASQRILKILEDVDLMTIESKQFDVIKEECLNILNLFDNTLRTFKDSLRNKHIHKTDRRALENELDLVHSNVHARINEIVDQRRENEKLLEIVSSVFSQDEGESRNREAIKDIKEAYTVFLSINVLDMSIEGEKRWSKAKKEYNLKIDRVEEEITNEMRDKLASAKTTNDMFRTFSKFNALFSRPRIRGAIQEYQNQILSSIKKDVKNFRDRVLVKYNSSEVYKINKSMNFPTLSGLLMWYIQLERKLGQYLERIQSVLGAGWEKHVAGQQLKQPIDQISKVLTDLKNNEFKEWEERISKINNIGQSKIFKIVTRGDGSLKMEVNLNERALSIVKEKNILK